MKRLRRVLIGAVIFSIAHAFMVPVAEWCVDYLKQSGGMVSATSLLFFKFFPWLASSFILWVFIWIANEWDDLP